MNNTILTDGTVLYYALKVNGKLVTAPMSDRFMLEQQRQALPQDQRLVAEIVTVTPSGQEVLLG